MAAIGAHVERPVRLGSEGTVVRLHFAFCMWAVAISGGNSIFRMARDYYVTPFTVSNFPVNLAMGFGYQVVFIAFLLK